MPKSISEIRSALDRVAKRSLQDARVHRPSFTIHSPRLGLNWSYGETGCYFIASTTKLYTTALVMQLRAEQQLSLDDRIVRYFTAEQLHGLHTFRKHDYANEITLRQLLAHTSGLADYFEQKPKHGTSLSEKVLANHDQAWNFNDVLFITKNQLTAKFAPGALGKAFYSDTNYQLLAQIIESVTGHSYETNLNERILSKLGLTQTYLFNDRVIDRYPTIAPLYAKNQPLYIPKAMASFGADGGMVSTAQESIVFLKAFMHGRLFPESDLLEMRQWKRIFFPLEYGVGIMRFRLPRIFTPFRPIPELIGHSGASGCVLFYAPKLDAYVSGTINQVANRSLSYKTMMQLIGLIA